MKHIEIRHHFIRDHVQNEDIILEFISIEDQLADIFTKPFLKETFEYLRTKLGVTYFPSLS